MEYRQRRRSKRSGGAPYGGALLLVTVTAIAIICLISLSQGGGWVARELIAPIFSIKEQSPGTAPDPTHSPSPAPQATASGADIMTKTLTVPAMNCYGLQMGVYSDRDNAAAQSADLQSLGAAGYILEDGGKYRVLAAGYLDEESLKTVRAQLETEGLISASYLRQCGEVELSVSTGETEMAALENALYGLNSTANALNAAFLRFDVEKLTLEQGKAALEAAVSGARDALSRLEAISAGLDASGRELMSLYGDICAQADAALALEEGARVAFSAALKRLYLFAAISAIGYLQGING